MPLKALFVAAVGAMAIGSTTLAAGLEKPAPITKLMCWQNGVQVLERDVSTDASRPADARRVNGKNGATIIFERGDNLCALLEYERDLSTVTVPLSHPPER